MASRLAAPLSVLSGYWRDVSVSPDGLHLSATWDGPITNRNGTASCLYGCDACDKYCTNWKPTAIGCCTGEQCCCCAPSAADGAGCTNAQCISISKGKCPTNQCAGPAPPPTPPAPPTPPGPGPAPTPPVPSGDVIQRTCKDAKCTDCQDNTLPQNTCLQLTGSTQSAKASCNADGSTLTLSIYNGKSCAGKVVQSEPQQTNVCLQATGGGYLEDLCPTGPSPPGPTPPGPTPPTPPAPPATPVPPPPATPAPPPAPTGPPVPPGSDGLSAINAYRVANGKAALAECTTGAKAQAIAEYDAANGKHAYTTKNGWDGVCTMGVASAAGQCESNGYSGGNAGATWADAVKAMQTACPSTLLGEHTCAAFGSCKDCSKSQSGKTRNFYVADFC